jgi:hypothetical protein
MIINLIEIGYFENRIGLFTKIMEDKVFSGTKDG